MVMQASPSVRSRRLRVRRPQRGLSLLFALLAVAALSLAAVGLVRTVGTGSLAIGNLAFKRDATVTADRGAEQAITWLQNNVAGAGLDLDVPASSYYATSVEVLDPTGRTSSATRALVDWDNDNCVNASGPFSACLNVAAPVTIGGNAVSWIITRLCSSAGSKDAAGNSCATSLASGAVDDANSGGMDYAEPKGLQANVTNPYYRVVVRTVGARNSVSFTETIVHF